MLTLVLILSECRPEGISKEDFGMCGGRRVKSCSLMAGLTSIKLTDILLWKCVGRLLVEDSRMRRGCV